MIANFVWLQFKVILWSVWNEVDNKSHFKTLCFVLQGIWQDAIPTRLILEENSFKFTNKLYLQRHGTAMGTKAAVAFANIFLAEIETQILRQSKHKPPELSLGNYKRRSTTIHSESKPIPPNNQIHVFG